MRLQWIEAEAAANEAFNVWVGRPELAWAKQAWHVLEMRGLADYSDEFERHTVAFRFLVLGGIYRDFCTVYWEETTDRSYSEWAASFELSPLILGQLYGQLADEPLTEDESEVLAALVESQRRVVVDALLAGFGGDVKLYESLAHSREPQDARLDDDHAFDRLDTTWQNSAGYGWVNEGCRPAFANG